MSKEQKFQLVRSAFPNVNQKWLQSKSELVIFCPKHHHHKQKLQINLDKNNFHCWVCHYSGLVPKLFREVGRDDLGRDYLSLMGVDTYDQEVVVKPVLMPSEAEPVHLNQTICEMVENKFNVSRSDIIKAKIHYCLSGEYQERIIVPSYDLNGNLNFFVTRTFNDWTSYKYRNCERKPREIIFNELFINWNEPLILTENVKTHIKMIDYENYTPILGSIFYEKSYLLNEMILNGTSEVILMLDRGAAKDTFKAAKKLLSYGFKVKIADDFGDQDQPDTLTRDEIVDCRNSAKEVDRMRLLKLKIQKGTNGQKNIDSYL